MLEPTYTKTFFIRSHEVDFTGRVRATALLNYLQEASGDHAHLLGVSVRDLLSRGLTWVLSRTHLRCLETLHSREEVRVLTWPSSRSGLFSCREFELSAADGRIVALATCSFAVLNLTTRKPVPVEECLPDYPMLPHRAIDDTFSSLPRLKEAETEIPFHVGVSDLDINRHANNVSYVKWALDTVPVDVVQGKMLTDLEISYRAEVFHGETVLARISRIASCPEETFLHQLTRDGTELTRLVSRWRP